MLRIYKSLNEDELITINNIEKGAWINLVSPTEEELEFVAANTGINSELIRPLLDEEERPHIETDDNRLLILINSPLVQQKSVMYDTIPLGIIVSDDIIVTVCLMEIDLLKELYSKKLKGFATFKKTRFVFQLLYRNASMYLRYLRDIDRKSNEIELESISLCEIRN
jgi:magnesium transporter